jgi:elongation factor 1-gamma
LETPEGTIFESAAIAKYLARLNPDSKLAGVGNHESALVDQWTDYANTAIYPHVFPILRASFGISKVDADTYNNALKELKASV